MRQEQSDDGDSSLLEGALQGTLDRLRYCLGRSRPASLWRRSKPPCRCCRGCGHCHGRCQVLARIHLAQQLPHQIGTTPAHH